LGSALSAAAEMIIPVHSRPFSRDFCQNREHDVSEERERGRERERERERGREGERGREREGGREREIKSWKQS
jgi:hypothetical protein